MEHLFQLKQRKTNIRDGDRCRINDILFDHLYCQRIDHDAVLDRNERHCCFFIGIGFLWDRLHYHGSAIELSDRTCTEPRSKRHYL